MSAASLGVIVPVCYFADDLAESLNRIIGEIDFREMDLDHSLPRKYSVEQEFEHRGRRRPRQLQSPCALTRFARLQGVPPRERATVF